MARRTRDSRLETRSSRLKLPVAKKPVFVKIGVGRGLGYRRNSTAGTWVARVSDGKGGNWTKAFATADDYADADGADILDFWQAQDRARTLARSGHKDDEDDPVKPVTFGQALDQYESDLQIRGADTGNVTRVKAHLPDALARRIVALATAKELRRWRDGLAKVLAPATVNRTANALRAALNLVADNDETITRQAWEIGLKSIEDAEESRNVILPEADVRAIIAKAIEQSAEFEMLVETLAITGARVSQAARLEVQDLQDGRDDLRLIMPSSRKGRGQKKIARRPVPIPASLAMKLRQLAAGRAPDAPLLTKPSGDRWRKSDHSRLFARAAKAADLDPDEVTANALRHSSIVRQLLANVPVRVVAVNHDTSVAMIERTYSRHIGDHADALASMALLDLAQPTAGNVVSLTGNRLNS